MGALSKTQQASQQVYKRLGDIFGATPGSSPYAASTADAACYAAYLDNKVEHTRLMDIYYKGEISAEQAAERVGFKVPAAGEYVGQIQKNLEANLGGGGDK